MRTQRHDHVHFGADAFDETANLVQVTWHVEHAVHRAKNVDPRPRAVFPLLLGRHAALGHSKLSEDPCHRAIGGFPLILVDGAR